MSSNAFQVPDKTIPSNDLAATGLQEFDGMARQLVQAGVNLISINDTRTPETPDSIFPNNWVSFHDDGTVVLYPMMAPNRRNERRLEILDMLTLEGFTISRILDLSYFEEQNKFLEGTGSMVLDRNNKTVYACISPRTHEDVLDVFCHEMGYKKVVFHAVDKSSQAIYHTNVMMCVGTQFILSCLSAITSNSERTHFVQAVKRSGKKLIDINFCQMEHFAGNMLEITTKDKVPTIVMSSTAFASLGHIKEELSGFGVLLHASLHSIETNGGGSARCMMAEIHLPRESII